MQIQTLESNGRVVSLFTPLIGQHRAYSLCHYQCIFHKPGQPDHCKIAQENEELCAKNGTEQPIFECPQFATQPIQCATVAEPVPTVADGGFTGAYTGEPIPVFSTESVALKSTIDAMDAGDLAVGHLLK
jgi:hypothetical protein